MCALQPFSLRDCCYIYWHLIGSGDCIIVGFRAMLFAFLVETTSRDFQ